MTDTKSPTPDDAPHESTAQTTRTPWQEFVDALNGQPSPRFGWMGELLFFNGLALLAVALLIFPLRAPLHLIWVLPVSLCAIAVGHLLRAGHAKAQADAKTAAASNNDAPNA